MYASDDTSQLYVQHLHNNLLAVKVRVDEPTDKWTFVLVELLSELKKDRIPDDIELMNLLVIILDNKHSCSWKHMCITGQGMYKSVFSIKILEWSF